MNREAIRVAIFASRSRSKTEQRIDGAGSLSLLLCLCPSRWSRSRRNRVQRPCLRAQAHCPETGRACHYRPRTAGRLPAGFARRPAPRGPVRRGRKKTGRPCRRSVCQPPSRAVRGKARSPNECLQQFGVSSSPLFASAVPRCRPQGAHTTDTARGFSAPPHVCGTSCSGSGKLPASSISARRRTGGM